MIIMLYFFKGPVSVILWTIVLLNLRTSYDFQYGKFTGQIPH